MKKRPKARPTAKVSKPEGSPRVQGVDPTAGGGSSRRRGRPAGGPGQGMISRAQTESLVAKLFCEGKSIGDIRKLVLAAHQVRLGRAEPWRILSRAAADRRFIYNPVHEGYLADRIRARFPWLLGASVVDSLVVDDVARQGAHDLLDLVRQVAHMRGTKEVHIGFAGGRCLASLARTFAALLRDPEAAHLPETIVLHALIAGFNLDDPSTDPNFFYTSFASSGSRVRTRLVALHAPGLVRPEQVEILKGFDAVRDAFDRMKEIDIFVTSAGHWQEGHSSLWAYLGPSPGSLDALKAAGCIGDMMWQPFDRDGPLRVETEVCPLTLLGLDDLPGVIERGKNVLLVIGPCGMCGGPKTEILRSVLASHRHLITHLTLDSRGASLLLQE